MASHCAKYLSSADNYKRGGMGERVLLGVTHYDYVIVQIFYFQYNLMMMCKVFFVMYDLASIMIAYKGNVILRSK